MINAEEKLSKLRNEQQNGGSDIPMHYHYK